MEIWDFLGIWFDEFFLDENLDENLDEFLFSSDYQTELIFISEFLGF